jgi:hypothetical protein
MSPSATSLGAIHMVNYRTKVFAYLTLIVVGGIFLPKVALAQDPNDFMRPF